MPTVEERLAALEAKSEAHAVSTIDVRGAVTELRGDVNRRFAEIQEQMNRRFDAVGQKMDRHFTWLVGINVAVLLAAVGALVGSYYR